MTAARVVITDANFGNVEAETRAAAGGGAAIERSNCRQAGEVEEAVAGAKVAVVQFAPFSAKAAAAMAPDGTVIRYGVGYENLDILAIRRLGLRAAYVPDYCTEEVADHTAAMVLALMRKLNSFDASVRSGAWAVQRVGLPLTPLSEAVIGFLGYGRIAQAVASRLSEFGPRFIAHDPYLNPATAKIAASRVSLGELFSVSDCLCLHSPSNKDTSGIVNAGNIARMKNAAYIVNTARGDLIEEAALAEALVEGRLGGAALDVFGSEPLNPSSPLRSAPNLLLSPHAAWYSDTAVDRLQGMVADEIARALDGRPPRCPIPDPINWTREESHGGIESCDH